MNNKGFTLIELLIVVAIIGILAAVGTAVIPNILNNAKEKATITNHNTVVNFVTQTLIESTMNGGYFNSMFPKNCGTPINKKFTPSVVSGVHNKFVDHLRCVINKHPWNDPVYPAINNGPRGILGSVEFYNRCTNSKPVMHIETVWNKKGEKLSKAIQVSDYDITC